MGMSNFTIVLGIISHLLGIGDVLGMNGPVFAVPLILIGVNLLYKN